MSITWENKLYYGDNLDIMHKHIPDESIDLIYLDPPFNSKTTYNVLHKEKKGTGSVVQIKAFDDKWHWNINSQREYEELVVNCSIKKLSNLIQALYSFLGTDDMMAYLTMMIIRLVEMHRILKPTGSIYLHCDPITSHYLKLILDAIFCTKGGNFRNEIIWHYRRWSASTSNFQRMHDTLFWYSKSSTQWIFTKPMQPYSHPEMIEDTIREVVNGKLQRLKNLDGTYIKRNKENKGVLMHDVWEDINFIPPTRKERLGYPTQKPEALLERIIKASSNEGNIVLDPFCGCGTTIVVAEKLNRKWIGIDISPFAISLTKKRLFLISGLFSSYSIIESNENNKIP